MVPARGTGKSTGAQPAVGRVRPVRVAVVPQPGSWGKRGGIRRRGRCGMLSTLGDELKVRGHCVTNIRGAEPGRGAGWRSGDAASDTGRALRPTGPLSHSLQEPVHGLTSPHEVRVNEKEPRMDPRQRLIDEVARLCGPSVAVLNLDEVQAGAPVSATQPRSAPRPGQSIRARRYARPRDRWRPARTAASPGTLA